MSIAMTQEEREAFLAEVHVGVIGIARRDKGPVTVPIWYGYEPGGDLWILIEEGSWKERLLTRAGRFTVCVQTETAPYKFVSVEGPIVSSERSVIARDEAAMALRYLGEEMGRVYIETIQGDPSNGPGLLIKMRPETWLASDFAKQFGTPSTG